ncbi:MAG: NADH-quinone oxidoreductase subunit NuoH [Aliifodinibius sp.]|nr:NADH-quinone oxidoreductase subunit NuoH [Fodinibius sp.]NIV11364.1 NADH-quinone oxidoreductase subunit NuoH [Fodinibius sp.]NIY24998.1 NADH-quinone oxidoreductase subunit NuoH [Fodinibius sp.]
MDASLLSTIIVVAKVVVVVSLLMLVVMGLTLAERKISAWIQDRHGPNRVGPKGLLQPIADGLKFFLKEDIIPSHVDKLLYFLAPAIALVPALMTFAIVPFGDQITIPVGDEMLTIKFQVADLNVGILYFFAIASLGVYGLIIGGFGSNNKYSMLGGLRSSAQMISYEIPMGLSIIAVIMMSGSLRLNDMVVDQHGLWNVIRQPLGFIIFLVASFAETNRLPFDLPEAEQELVGGYHTEYSSMKFSSFFIAEYSNMITSSALIVTLYFGGWHIPGLQSTNIAIWLEQILQILAFIIKTGIFLFIFMWVRWTLPRFRYDQLMNLGWKGMLPLALFNIVVTGVVMTYV